MWCCTSNNFAIGIKVSIWTIVQTSFHIIWVLCGYYFYVCKIRPSHYVLVMVYLTYFYKDDCGDIMLDRNEIFITKKPHIRQTIKLYTNDTDEDLYDIIDTILEKAVLPKESSAAWRTHMYFHAFIVTDAIWIITAFLLFAGTCFQIKKCLSLLFYCPWLIVTACIILLDVISAVHFGLDIQRVYNITTWLKFIGVQNYNDFSNLNKNEISRMAAAIPAFSLCVLFSRMLVFWILNIVNFFQILTMTVLAFQDNIDRKDLLHQQNTGSKDSPSGDLNLNTSAARIRNWQLFYGATETTSTESSSSSRSSEKDCNSNKSFRRSSKESVRGNTETFTKLPQGTFSSEAYGRYPSSIRDDSTRSRVSTYYRGFPEVDDDIDISNKFNGTDKVDSTDKVNGDEKNVSVIGSLRSQLPWSYFPTPMEVGKSKSDLEINVAVSEFGRFRAMKRAVGKDMTASSEL